MFRRIVVILFLGAATLLADADWGAVKALTAGTRIRITMATSTASGQLDSVTDDALTFAAGKSHQTIHREQISLVSVRTPGHRRRNTLIGLAAGAGVGLGVGVASRSSPNQLHFVSNSAVIGLAVAAGALIGTAIGAIIPTGGWREVYKASALPAH